MTTMDHWDDDEPPPFRSRERVVEAFTNVSFGIFIGLAAAFLLAMALFTTDGIAVF